MMLTGWHSRGYLPHLNAGQVPQMLTFRVAGSVPAGLLERLRQELRREAEVERERLLRLSIERHLDAGNGPLWLARTEIAAVIENAMLHFDGRRYSLLSWCIMPNHVHALAVPMHPHDLSDILFSWKSFSAQRSNELLDRKGAFWDPDYFDRYIRDERHLARAIEYIEMNPVKAGLCGRPEEWQWCSARRR